MADADEAEAKTAALTMRKHVTTVITEVVRALGGDSVTGRQHLCAEKTPLTLFGHALRGVPLPKGCPAADTPHEQLWASLEKIHGKLDASGNLPEAELRKLRTALMPRAQQAPAPAPIFGTATAAPASGFVPLFGHSPAGGAAASSSSAPLFGPPRPGYGA